MSLDAKVGYVEILQDALKRAFFAAVLRSNENSQVKEFFEKIHHVGFLESRQERENAINKIYQKLSDKKHILAKILELDAKRQSILHHARKQGNSHILEEYKEHYLDQSHSLSSELFKCHKSNLSASVVQHYLDIHLRAVFSLTGHPTNPHSVDFVALEYELDRILSDQKYGENDLKNILDKIITCPIYQGKKTPIQEMQETELALKTLQENYPKIRANLEEAIEKSPYRGQIKLPQKILEVSVWTHGGDGDGNPNITTEVLKEGIKRVENFDEVKIDIRHDSVDLMKIAEDVLEKLGVVDFAKIPTKNQVEILTKYLSEKKVSDTLGVRHLQGRSLEIFERLSICAQNPHKVEKLIIANASGVNHVLAALFCLQVTGNIVAREGAKIDIVTLSESIEDLKSIADVQKELLANEVYRRHLKYRGRIIQMIAKSDTFRVGGPGAVYYQDDATGKAYLLGKIAKEKYGLDLEIRVFSGGGAALQRGGGKPAEIANRQAQMALVQESTTILKKGPTSTTIQGRQQHLVCAPGVVVNAMEEFMAQNLHSALIAEKKIPTKNSIDFGIKERREFSEDEVKAYKEKYFKNPFITELFARANRLGVEMGNASSRPSKRGVSKSQSQAGVKYIDLIGKDFDLFGTRAITLDRMLAHSGTFIVMFLGVNEAFEKNSPEVMYKIYEKNKAFRDFVRNQITVLYMVDLHYSWEMMACQKRPEDSEIKALAAKFKTMTKEEIPEENERIKITLAYLDLYINDVAKNMYKVFTGEEIPTDFDIKTMLKIYSPELSSEMDHRRKEGCFAKFVERETIKNFNLNREKILDQFDLDIVINSYIATNHQFNAPVGMSSTFTSVAINAKGKRSSKSPVKHLSQGLDLESLKRKIPTCLQNYIEQN